MSSISLTFGQISEFELIHNFTNSVMLTVFMIVIRYCCVFHCDVWQPQFIDLSLTAILPYLLPERHFIDIAIKRTLS